MTRGWSEDALHRWLARTVFGRHAPGRGRARRALSGSAMHDAAVLRAFGGLPVVCVDQCIEGVHFDAAADARAAGRKAALRALSDLAATAAAPRAIVVALRAPAEREERWLRRAIEGARAAAREHGAELVGGDLASSEGPAALSVTALGVFDLAVRPPGRDRARAGDLVLVTGPCGGSGLGRHLAIEPRFAETRFLVENGARASMDVSDGLAWDLFRLARASRVRAALELAAVPVHRDARRLARASGRPPLDHALHDGEDHEILATIAPARWRAIEREAARRFPRLAIVGRIERGRGLDLVRADGARERWTSAMGGWRHGA